MPRWVNYVVIAAAAWLLGLAWALSSPVGILRRRLPPHIDLVRQGQRGRLHRERRCAAGLVGGGAEDALRVPVLRVQAGRERGVQRAVAWHQGRGGVVDTERTAHVLRGDGAVRGPGCGPICAGDAHGGGNGRDSCARSGGMGTPRLRDTQLCAWCAVSIPLWIFSFLPRAPPGGEWLASRRCGRRRSALLHAQGRRQYVVAGVAVALAAVPSGVRADTAAMSVAILVVVLGMWLRRRIQWPAAVLGRWSWASSWSSFWSRDRAVP